LLLVLLLVEVVEVVVLLPLSLRSRGRQQL
jgi:hypothetical protein